MCDDISEAFYEAGVDPYGKGMVQYFEMLPGEKNLYKGLPGEDNRIGVVIK